MGDGIGSGLISVVSWFLNGVLSVLALSFCVIHPPTYLPTPLTGASRPPAAAGGGGGARGDRGGGAGEAQAGVQAHAVCFVLFCFVGWVVGLASTNHHRRFIHSSLHLPFNRPFLYYATQLRRPGPRDRRARERHPGVMRLICVFHVLRWIDATHALACIC